MPSNEQEGAENARYFQRCLSGKYYCVGNESFQKNYLMSTLGSN